VAKQFAETIGSIGQSLPKVEFENGKIKLMPSDSFYEKTKVVESNGIGSTKEDLKDKRLIGESSDESKVMNTRCASKNGNQM